MYRGSGGGGCVELWSQAKQFFDIVIWSWGNQWEILLAAIGECCLCRMHTAKSRSARVASHQPAFMGNCHTFLACTYSRWVSPCVLYFPITGVIISQIIRGYRTQGLTPGFWSGEYGLSAMGVDAILGNWCGTKGKSYVKLLQGSEIISGFYYRNWILRI